MHDTLFAILCSIAAMSAAFLAGLKWRDRCRAGIEQAQNAAIVRLDERVEQLESVVLLSTDRSAA